MHNKGIVVLLISALCFSFAGVFIRFISQDVGTFYQLTIRTLLMTLGFVAIGYFTKSLTKTAKKDIPLIIFRGVLVVLDFAVFIYAVNHLSLGLSLFIFYAGSLLANYLYGYFLLKETLNKVKIVSLGLATTGLLVLYAGDFGTIHILGSLAALVSGLSFGTTSSASKNLSDKYSVAQVNLYAYCIGFVLSGFLLLLSGENITLTVPISTWYALIGFSAIFVIAFYGTVYGYKYVQAQYASLLLLAEILFALFVGFIFYQEIPTFAQFVGGILILTGLVVATKFE